MTSRERVRVAMSGGKPDRVPVVPQICPPHAIRVAGLPFEETTVDLLRNPRKYDLLVAQCAAEYGVDGVRVWLGGPPTNVEWRGGQAVEVDPDTGDAIGTVDFMGGGHPVRFKHMYRRLTDDDIEQIQVIPADELLQSEALVPAQKVIAQFGDDLFIIGVPMAFMVESMFFTQGMEMSLMDMLDRPDFVKRLTEKQLEVAIQQAIALVRAGVEALYIGETFGQFMSPQQFSELCLPYVRRFVEALRPYGPLMYLHMCGRITHLLDLIPETGVDCLDPVDTAGGTPVAEVKERIGDRVALMGGANTVLLSRGSLEEVEADCAACIRDGGEGGGYILAACDMLPTETSQEKVRAMVQCAETVGRYG